MNGDDRDTNSQVWLLEGLEGWMLGVESTKRLCTWSMNARTISSQKELTLAWAIDMAIFELDLVEESDLHFKKLSLGDKMLERYVELQTMELQIF